VAAVGGGGLCHGLLAGWVLFLSPKEPVIIGRVT